MQQTQPDQISELQAHLAPIGSGREIRHQICGLKPNNLLFGLERVYSKKTTTLQARVTKNLTI